jgi:hypothetical protein
MPNESCRLLTNGFKFTLSENNIQYGPCCQFKGPLVSVAAPESEQKQYRAMLAGIDSYSSQYCNICNYQEKTGTRATWRQYSKFIVPDDAVVGEASYIEIQLDNTCNAACIMCGPWNSSLWAAEESKASNIKIHSPRVNVDDIKSVVNIQDAKRIMFLGGETFLLNADQIILTQIENPENVDLQYTVNCSIYPSAARIALWSKFKSVLINFSVDGIGDRFEYIRYPLKWKTTKTNITRMIGELPPNVKFKMNHAVNIFNLYYYDEFAAWAATVLTKEGTPIPYTFTPVTGELSPQQVTSAYYTLLQKKYNHSSKVMQCITSQDLSPNNLLTYIGKLDARRGNNWQNVFPEIAQVFS